MYPFSHLPSHRGGHRRSFYSRRRRYIHQTIVQIIANASETAYMTDAFKWQRLWSTRNTSCILVTKVTIQYHLQTVSNVNAMQVRSVILVEVRRKCDCVWEGYMASNSCALLQDPSKQPSTGHGSTTPLAHCITYTRPYTRTRTRTRTRTHDGKPAIRAPGSQ